MESSRAEGTFSLTRGQNFMLGITKTTWHYCSKAHTDRAVNASGTPRKLLANYPLPSLWSSYSIFFMTCDVHDSKTISQISLHYASEAAISLLPWLEKKREVMCSLMIGTSYFYESYFHSAFDYLWKTHRNTWQVRGVRARWSLPISCAQQLSQLIKPRGSFR